MTKTTKFAWLMGFTGVMMYLVGSARQNNALKYQAATANGSWKPLDLSDTERPSLEELLEKVELDPSEEAHVSRVLTILACWDELWAEGNPLCGTDLIALEIADRCEVEVDEVLAVTSMVLGEKLL